METIVFGSLPPVPVPLKEGDAARCETVDDDDDIPDNEVYTAYQKSCDEYDGRPEVFFWTPPAHGRHRVDVSASFEEEHATVGYGVIVRDHNGQPLIATSDVSPAASTPSLLLIHLEAIRQGLELAVCCGVREVTLFTDSAYANDVIRGTACPYSRDSKLLDSLHLNLKQIKNLRSTLLSCTLQYCYQQNILASHYLSGLHATNEFKEVLPDPLLEILERDLASRAGYGLHEVVIDTGAILRACSYDSLTAQLVAVKFSLQAASGYGYREVRILTDAAPIIWRKKDIIPTPEPYIMRLVPQIVEAIESLVKKFDRGCFFHSRQNNVPTNPNVCDYNSLSRQVETEMPWHEWAKTRN